MSRNVVWRNLPPWWSNIAPRHADFVWHESAGISSMTAPRWRPFATTTSTLFSWNISARKRAANAPTPNPKDPSPRKSSPKNPKLLPFPFQRLPNASIWWSTAPKTRNSVDTHLTQKWWPKTAPKLVATAMTTPRAPKRAAPQSWVRERAAAAGELTAKISTNSANLGSKMDSANHPNTQKITKKKHVQNLVVFAKGIHFWWSCFSLPFDSVVSVCTFRNCVVCELMPRGIEHPFRRVTSNCSFSVIYY